MPNCYNCGEDMEEAHFISHVNGKPVCIGCAGPCDTLTEDEMLLVEQKGYWALWRVKPVGVKA